METFGYRKENFIIRRHSPQPYINRLFTIQPKILNRSIPPRSKSDKSAIDWKMNFDEHIKLLVAFEKS